VPDTQGRLTHVDPLQRKSEKEPLGHAAHSL
jgi:hypothetical protein